MPILAKIEENKERLKLLIVISALSIGLFSIVYTNILVDQLESREVEQMGLYAEAQGIFLQTEGEAQDFLFKEIIQKNNSIPVILTDAERNILDSRNISFPPNASEERRQRILSKELEKMADENPPLKIEIAEGYVQYVYYRNSFLLTQLKFYPAIMLMALFLLGLLAYVMFSTARRAEQNRVWVGLAKETAHQLGTPISSLMAWIEYLRLDDHFDPEIADEMDKDIKRLEMVTARFSSIGSEPVLSQADVGEVTEGVLNYLRMRVSSKVRINYTPKYGQELLANLNIPLFEWVIENLCKNAVDAMNGSGRIDVYARYSRDFRYIELDISDTGKGIPAHQIKKVFLPGFTTKRRGWGLGLTLTKRIVEEYHKGKIFVKRSEVGHGTTFRVLIPMVSANKIETVEDGRWSASMNHRHENGDGADPQWRMEGSDLSQRREESE